MARKFIYYLNGYSRTIVITDNDDGRPIEEITEKISKIMSGCKVSKFETDNDILIIRPSDIVAVHIEKDSSKHDDNRMEESIDLQSVVPDIDLDDLDTNDIEEEPENIEVDNSLDAYEIEEDLEDKSTEVEDVKSD